MDTQFCFVITPAFPHPAPDNFELTTRSLYNPRFVSDAIYARSY